MPGVLNQISGTARSIQSANVDTQLKLGKSGFDSSKNPPQWKVKQ